MGVGEFGDNLAVAGDENVLRRCKQKIRRIDRPQMPPFLAAFCFLPFLLMAVPSLRLRHRHLIIALHGHQLMQPVAFLAVIVVALVFLGHEGLNLRNDLPALRKLLGCAKLVSWRLAASLMIKSASCAA